MLMSFLPLPATNTVVYAFQTSDWIGQGIVEILFVISIAAWIIILEKSILLRRVQRENAAILERFKTLPTPLDFIPGMDRYAGPLIQVYRAAIDTLAEVLQLDAKGIDICCRQRTLPRALNEVEIAKIRSALEQAVSDQTALLERRMVVLGTFISTSPMLGLLGTVWGIMSAFCSLAEKGRADISALAPGVSGALLTTVAGLVVAIPAAVGYNLMLHRIQRLNGDMELFADNVIAGLRLYGRE